MVIQYVQNELNDLKNKYINDQNGSFGNSGGSDEFKGREDRLLISHETNINNNNDNNNPTGLIEPIDTNINTVEENNRILSDQSNNINSNQGAYETKEDDNNSTWVNEPDENMNTNSLFNYNGKNYKTEAAMKAAITRVVKKSKKTKK